MAFVNKSVCLEKRIENRRFSDPRPNKFLHLRSLRYITFYFGNAISQLKIFQLHIPDFYKQSNYFVHIVLLL